MKKALSLYKIMLKKGGYVSHRGCGSRFLGVVFVVMTADKAVIADRYRCL